MGPLASLAFWAKVNERPCLTKPGMGWGWSGEVAHCLCSLCEHKDSASTPTFKRRWRTPEKPIQGVYLCVHVCTRECVRFWRHMPVVPALRVEAGRSAGAPSQKPFKLTHKPMYTCTHMLTLQPDSAKLGLPPLASTS